MNTPLLTTTTALTRAWRNLVQGHTFTRHSIWLMLLDAEHRPVCPVIELEDAVDPPAVSDLAPLTVFLAELAQELPHAPARVAVLRSRPGGGLPTGQDREWATVMRHASETAGLECLAVHFADEEHLVALPSRVGAPVRSEQPGQQGA